MHSKDIAVGYAIGYNDGLGQGGGEIEEWSPPKEWPEIPEPSAYEIYLLISADDFTNSSNQARFALVDPVDCAIGNGPVTVDWGDGNIETWADGEWTSDFLHTYETYGLYVIKIIATKTSSLFGVRSSYRRINWLIAKLGSEIVVTNGNSDDYRGFYQQYKLQYIKMSGKNGLSPYCFYECYALRKIDIDYLPAAIPQYAFAYCNCLKKFDFSDVKTIGMNAIMNTGITSVNMPECTQIGDSGLRQNPNLVSINAPKCIAVGNYGLNNNYALQTYKFADGCIFGTNAFAGCYSLYPYRNQ